MLIKDLSFKHNTIVNNNVGSDLFVIEFFAYVVINRDGEYYEIPVRMDYEVLEKDSNKVVCAAVDTFIERCQKIYDNWIIITSSNSGKLMGQNKIIL